MSTSRLLSPGGRGGRIAHWLAPASIPAFLLMLIPVALGCQTFGSQLPLHQIIYLGDPIFPSLQTDNTSGCRYYLAASGQQVYGYFIRQDYQRAPLVLELNIGRYVQADALKAACGGSAVSASNASAGTRHSTGRAR